MPTPIYDDLLVRSSTKHLERVAHALPIRTVLAGGHAVRLRVEKQWWAAHGEAYFGSRDIDLCFAVQPEWTEERLRENGLDAVVDAIHDAGFQPVSRNRFGCRLNEDGSIQQGHTADLESAAIPRILYLDPLVTNLNSGLADLFGVRPTYEPLLEAAFHLEPRDYLFTERLILPPSALLVATKLRSLPKRHRPDKQIKDLADLYALAAYGDEDAAEIRRVLHATLPDAHGLVDQALRHPHMKDAAHHLGIEPSELRAVVGPLALPPR